MQFLGIKCNDPSAPTEWGRLCLKSSTLQGRHPRLPRAKKTGGAPSQNWRRRKDDKTTWNFTLLISLPTILALLARRCKYRQRRHIRHQHTSATYAHLLYIQSNGQLIVCDFLFLMLSMMMTDETKHHGQCWLPMICGYMPRHRDRDKNGNEIGDGCMKKTRR